MAVSGDPHVLIVAGSDSSGGAGIARDVETASAIGPKTCLAITAVTAQTHAAVERVELMPAALVAAQMEAALAANPVRAVKIGMLGSAEIVEAVAEVLAEHRGIPVVLDPVLAASSGRPLLEADAMALLKALLMPLCAVVTPNLPELGLLAGEAPAADEAAIELQAQALLATGCAAALVKGGHDTGEQAVDLLVRSGAATIRFEHPRIGASMRGTGCMLSSAIAAHLALGARLETALAEAKALVTRYLQQRLLAAG